MQIHVNGVDLYYEKSGSGRPLLLIHGNGEDHSIFDEAVSILQNSFTVYAIDSRGHGQSSTVTELHYQDMAEDLVAFMEALDLSDVLFYGFSDGGIIGLLVALKTKRVTRMIISGANTKVYGVRWKYLIREAFKEMKSHDMFRKMVLTEPNITDRMLAQIKIPVVVLAGKRDLIREPHTRRIARHLANSQLHILADETHGSYIVHQTKIAELILRFSAEA